MAVCTRGSAKRINAYPLITTTKPTTCHSFEGKLVYPNGDVDVAQCKAGQKEGKGIMTFKTGGVYLICGAVEGGSQGGRADADI
jgi:hypothetical protein